MTHPAWLLVLTGVLLALAGLVWMLSPAVPWLGRLPGDVRVENEHGGFYFPFTTCILLSLVLTAIAWFVHQLWQ